MSATYIASEVELDPATQRVRARFELRNDTTETWRASEGFAVGYHLFDADSGMLVVDGERVGPPRDIAPGQSFAVELEFDWPSEDGEYRVIFSPMREGVCWYYERNWPFLLVEGVTRDGAGRIGKPRISRSQALRFHRAVRSLGRAFTLPVASIWSNRALIRTMVRRDILGRYRGSFAGGFWTVISPLLLMLTYFFVFSLVLRSRFPGDPSRAGFALYFLAGMLPWLAFSEALGRAPTVLLEHRNFVKKLVFPVETLPANLAASGLVSEFFAVLLFVLALLTLRGGLPPTIVWLPLILIPQILFTAGLAWFLAALGIFVLDLGQAIGFVLTIWFFLTPICYPEAALAGLPPSVTLWLAGNPLYVLVRAYRAILLDQQAPAFGPLWKFWIVSIAVFVAGHAWFHKLRKSFADII
jgi:lipopolysaccharide transport system permease protein